MDFLSKYNYATLTDTTNWSQYITHVINGYFLLNLETAIAERNDKVSVEVNEQLLSKTWINASSHDLFAVGLMDECEHVKNLDIIISIKFIMW